MIDILIAILLDLLIGDPYNFPHPVKFMGNIINMEEKMIREKTKNRSKLRKYGLIIAVINILIFFFIPYIILKLLKNKKIIHSIINIYLIYTCISARSLEKEALKVSSALKKEIEYARYRLSFIVGRDTYNLKEDEIIKATIETVAENTSDGVIAPLFYIFIFGTPGGIMYKMVNTMDSMLGYTNDEYIDLGRYPAIIDDILNYIPARLTGVLMCMSSIFRFNFQRGFKIMLRDRRKHKSPNSGWPESAVAGLLGIELGGDGTYRGELIEKPTIGDNTIGVQNKHIIDAIQIMYRTEILFIAIYTFYSLVFI